MIKPKGLLIALVLLAVLGGVTWWSNKKKAAEAAKSTTDSANKVLSVPEDQIREIRIQKTGADAIVLRRDDAKKWSIVEPKPLPADQDAAGQVASTLSSLNADKIIEEKAADLTA